MSDSWFYTKDTQRLGPVPDWKLRQLAVAGEIDNSTPLFTDAAKGEVHLRDILFCPPISENIPSKALFFAPTDPTKVGIMCALVPGYEIFWWYRNWKYIARTHSLNIWPFWRAIFACFYCWPLFRIVKEYENQNEIPSKFRPGLLALAWLILVLIGSAKQISGLSFLSVFPVVVVQKAMNRVNAHLSEQKTVDAAFSFANIVGIIVGIALLVLIFIYKQKVGNPQH